MLHNSVIYHNGCFLNWTGQKGNPFLLFVYCREKNIASHTAGNIYLYVLLSFIY